MAKVTRIKASDGPRTEEADQPAITRKKVTVKDKKTEKAKRDKIKAAEKKIVKGEKKKKPFILIRPFVALFGYFRAAWRELRQVRWPNRKTTWKMVLAVLAYTAGFVILISLLDLFFSWLFGILLK